MLKVSKNQIILLILGVIFLLVYSYLSFATPARFNSPDEAANYFWTSKYAQGEELKVSQPLNPEIGNVIHLRSDNVNSAGQIVPGSFLGLIILYGLLAKIFGLGAIKFFTPVFAVLAGWCFYCLIKKFFAERVALLATILLFLNPAWWYYTERGLLPNVLFVSLLIIGFWFLGGIKKVESGEHKLKIGNYIIGGLFVGLALTVRTAEIFWVAAVLIIVAITYRRRINWWGVILFLIMIALTFLPILQLNRNLYGSYFLSGYSELSSATTSTTSIASSLTPRPPVLPFGFHPWNILNNFWNYYVVIAWWYFVPLALGLFWLKIGTLRRWWQKMKGLLSSGEKVFDLRQMVYLSIFVLVNVWLVIYYGSWKITDNIAGQITIGTSYLRYWLPAFILGLPLIAWLILKIYDHLPKKIFKMIWIVIMFLFFGTLSANLVFNYDEGVLAVAKNIQEYQKINDAAKSLFSPGAIVISDRSDKIFWPEFGVARFTGNNAVFEKIAKIVTKTPVYYYLPKKLSADNLSELNKSLMFPSPWPLQLEECGTLSGADGYYLLYNPLSSTMRFNCAK